MSRCSKSLWTLARLVPALLLWWGALLSVPAWSGSVYNCDSGEVHQFWGCVNPEKPPPMPCQPTAGNPVDVLTGRKHQEVVDWSSGGQNPLELRRYYSSSPFTLVASPYSSVGRGWRTNFDARARWSGTTLANADWVHIVLPDHFEYHFQKQAGVWRTMIPRSGGSSIWPSSVQWSMRNDLDAGLTIVDGKWIVFRTPNDVEYVFDSAEHQPDVQYRSDGLHVSLLSEIRYAGGYAQNLNYSGDQLVRIIDSFGRWLEFDYQRSPTVSFLLSQVRTSDGKTIRFSYENRFPALPPTQLVDFWALSTVTYPDDTPGIDSDNPTVSYEYKDAAGKPGLLLTGIMDERGVRFASWSYDAKGRVVVSEHAGGADRWQFSYDDKGQSVIVTNPLGRATIYRYGKIVGGLRQLLAVDGVATGNCSASNTRYEYDSNGFRSRATDAEGYASQWVRDARGRPLTITEGMGSGATKTTLMTWDAMHPRLLSVDRASKVTSYSYSESGQVTRMAEVDTGKQSVPYATAGQTRQVSYTYTAFRPAVPALPASLGPATLPRVALRVDNPDASQGLLGWTNMLNSWRYVGTRGDDGSIPCSGKTNCSFWGNSAYELGIAYQDVAIPAAVVQEVDSGLRAAESSWRQVANGCCQDTHLSVSMVFLNAAGATIGSSVPSRENEANWTRRSNTAPVPAGTRTIRVAMSFDCGTTYCTGSIDDISLALVADRSAAPNPFLEVVNPSGVTLATTGWTAEPGKGKVMARLLGTGPFGTGLAAYDGPGGKSAARQTIDIPSSRIAEIDSGGRGLELSWVTFAADTNDGSLIATVEFLDSAGLVLATRSSLNYYMGRNEQQQRRFQLPVIPPGTRRINLIMSSSFPANSPGRRWAFWWDMKAQLTPAGERPANPVELLSAIDGPLPGPSDTVRYSYDKRGNLASVTDELGHLTRITKTDGAGRPQRIVDPNGVVTWLSYDPRGRLTTIMVNPGRNQARTVIAYDAVGQITRITAPDASFLQYNWDAARRLTSVSNNGGERIEYDYNANGDVIARRVRHGSGALIRQQSAVFDELGRLLKQIGAAGQATLFSYDRTDNLVQLKDPRGGVFSYAYDGLQQLIRTTDQSGSTVQLGRDAQGSVAAYSDPRGLTTSYVRNGFGEVIQESGPDVGTTVIARDQRGLPVKITDPRGVVTLLGYDAAGRLLSEAYPADPSQNVTYSYDDTSNGNRGIGHLTAVSDGSGSTVRGYDALGRVVAERRVIGDRSYVISYGYNAAGRLLSITYPSGRTVFYKRRAFGPVNDVSMSGPGSDVVVPIASHVRWQPMTATYQSLDFANGLGENRDFDGDGRLASLRLKDGRTFLQNQAYSYGDGMNLTAITDLVSARQSVTLGYDAAQRLATAKGPWGSLAYGYTPNGDRLRETLTPPGGSPLTTALHYPADSNRLSATAIDGFTTRSFAYDAAGNVTSMVMGSQRLDIAYNVRNRPVLVTRSGGSTGSSAYVFNALEQLVSRRTDAPGGPSGSVHYIYGLDGALLSEADGATGAILRDYIWLPSDGAPPVAANDNAAAQDGQPLPLAVVSGVDTPSPRLLMVHTDHLGRPVRMTDMAKSTVWQASYDPFGQPVSLTGSAEQNLRFPGQYYLLETGLSYNWHRFYDPATGRYTQPDPLRFVDGPSVYGYAGQSPLMRVDPEGRQALPLPLPLPPPFMVIPNKPKSPWMPGWNGPIPHSSAAGGSGSGGGGMIDAK